VNKGRSQVRVAVKCGLLKSWYAYHRLGRVSGKSNDVALNGLTDALNGWESMKVISEREAARKSSLVGVKERQGQLQHKLMQLLQSRSNLLLGVSP